MKGTTGLFVFRFCAGGGRKASRQFAQSGSSRVKAVWSGEPNSLSHNGSGDQAWEVSLQWQNPMEWFEKSAIEVEKEICEINESYYFCYSCVWRERQKGKKRWKEAGWLVKARGNRFSPRVIGPLFSDNWKLCLRFGQSQHGRVSAHTHTHTHTHTHRQVRMMPTVRITLLLKITDFYFINVYFLLIFPPFFLFFCGTQKKIFWRMPYILFTQWNSMTVIVLTKTVKISSFVVHRRKSCSFGTKWGQVNDDRIFVFFFSFYVALLYTFIALVLIL